jgi:hypothetical protein
MKGARPQILFGDHAPTGWFPDQFGLSGIIFHQCDGFTGALFGFGEYGFNGLQI